MTRAVLFLAAAVVGYRWTRRRRAVRALREALAEYETEYAHDWRMQ